MKHTHLFLQTFTCDPGSQFLMIIDSAIKTIARCFATVSFIYSKYDYLYILEKNSSS